MRLPGKGALAHPMAPALKIQHLEGPETLLAGGPGGRMGRSEGRPLPGVQKARHLHPAPLGSSWAGQLGFGATGRTAGGILKGVLPQPGPQAHWAALGVRWVKHHQSRHEETEGGEGSLKGGTEPALGQTEGPHQTVALPHCTEALQMAVGVHTRVGLDCMGLQVGIVPEGLLLVDKGAQLEEVDSLLGEGGILGILGPESSR